MACDNTGRWAAVGDDSRGVNYYILESIDDGVTWRQTTGTPFNSTSSKAKGIAANNAGRWVAVSNNPGSNILIGT